MRMIVDKKAVPIHSNGIRDGWYHTFDWSKFENDERTKDLILHWGCDFDVKKSPNKINVLIAAEHPGIFFVGKTPGQNVHIQERMESSFDHLITYNLQVANSGRGYDFIPLPYDVEFVHRQLSIDNIDSINKDIDVQICGSNPRPDFPLNNWVDVVRKFSHSYCGHNAAFKPWNEKQMEIARSKISIVWSVFFGASENSKNYANIKFPWIKFNKGPDMSRWLTPHMKGRIHDAAALKTLMLCYKGPFAGKEDPYNNSIEYYYEPGVDFLYFENAEDLQAKINMILGDYDSYRCIADNAYNKIVNDHKIEDWYEKYIVPLASKK